MKTRHGTLVATGLQSGQVTVETAGQPIQLVDKGIACFAVLVCNPNNNKELYVGCSNVSKDGPKAVVLAPGERVQLPVSDASQVWVDSNGNNKDVSFLILK